MKSGQTGVEIRCCQSSSDETAGPSGRWTPALGTDVLPHDCSDHGIPNSTYRGKWSNKDEIKAGFAIKLGNKNKRYQHNVDQTSKRTLTFLQ